MTITRDSEALYTFNITLWVVILSVFIVLATVYMTAKAGSDERDQDPYLFKSPDMQLVPPIETKDWLSARPVF